MARGKVGKYRGVSKVRHKWLAQIWHSGTANSLGRFLTPEAAAKAYDKEVLRMGLNRPLNFPNEHTQPPPERPMPTHAQKQRIQDIQNYFRQNWLGKITTINQAADDIRQRFG